jgi:hypothetical protein
MVFCEKAVTLTATLSSDSARLWAVTMISSSLPVSSCATWPFAGDIPSGVSNAPNAATL